MLLNRKLEEYVNDNLFFDHKFQADAKSIQVDEGTGVLKRGTVMQYDSGIYSTLDGSGTADCILTDDFSLEEINAETNTVVMTAYRTGHFNSRALIVADGYEMTREDITNLRNGGIFISTSVDYEGGIN